jgi:hypothetical protein
VRIALALCLTVFVACQPRSRSSNPSSSVWSDTLRGVVVVEGSEPGIRVFLNGSAGRTELISSSVRFHQLAGLEVQVVGRSVARQFDVRAFRVRAARGQQALDGTLRIRDGTIYLSLTDGGERPLREGRGLFEARVGSRIWLVMSVDGGVAEFGILDNGKD